MRSSVDLVGEVRSMTYWETQGAVQARMRENGIDGWLLMDFRGTNPFMARVLGRGGIGGIVTRRTFAWLPAKPDARPVVLAQAREAHALTDHRWDVRVYADAASLRSQLAALGPCDRLAGATVAMEMSPLGALPYVSRIDAGTVGLIECLGATVVTSADLLQDCLARLSADQVAQHARAAYLIDAAKDDAFAFVANQIALGCPVDEFAVQSRLMARFTADGLVTDAAPTVACGPNSARGHYVPRAGHARAIGSDDWLLIDLWARVDQPGSPYADVTWVAWTGPSPVPARHREVFGIVRQARDLAVSMIGGAAREGYTLQGWQVDRAVRDFIAENGHGHQFPHRTGHNLGPEEVHGTAGVCLDDFETHDTRLIIPGVAFSVEPGIYLEGEFGVRLELNVVMGANGPEVHTPVQAEIVELGAGGPVG
jgi:Xaa-Pro dipeptidase